MKKSKFLLLIIGFFIFSINLIDTNAWCNGSYAYSRATYDLETDFGTHDWIAELTLEMLMGYNTTKYQWLEDRREIFFLGTEAPDNDEVNVNLDGIELSGFGDTTKHHIYFYENGTICEDDSALRAKWCGDWADVYYGESKLDLASFYLGAMTHYISDVSMYAHTCENYVEPYFLNFDEHHSQVEGYVQSRTNEYDDLEEFFEISEYPSSICSITVVSSKTPYNCAIDLAWDTYKDPNPSETIIRDVVWLHNNFFTGWALSYESRITETNQIKTLYYNRIEQSLHNAIFSCVMAVEHIIDGTFGIYEYNYDSYLALPSFPILILSIISIISTIIIVIIRKKGILRF